MTKCTYTLKDGVLTVGNRLFSKDFANIAAAQADIVTPKSRALPYYEVKALRANDSKVTYSLWEDIPVVRISDDSEDVLLNLEGEHWIARAVKLNAFTDDVDTLTEENEYHYFYKGFQKPLVGDIFFLEDPETDNAYVIISENPGWTKAELHIPQRGDCRVFIRNHRYPVVLGFCKAGECEALCRSYLRHINNCPELVTMSNTWGDCNAAGRVCEQFISNEIDAAEEIGVDIVQIDDGWQSRGTLYPGTNDRYGRIFGDHAWELNTQRFPNGIKPLTEKAEKAGVKVGMWFAPSSRLDFSYLQRDKDVMTQCYNEHGARFFKLDMYETECMLHTDMFRDFLAHIYSLGDDVSVQLDVTRNDRLEYLCGYEYGTVFVENRYTKTANSFPHRVLRNLWCISRYVPSNRFQFELVNPDLNKESYREGDTFAPSYCDMDYLFACVMMSNPLFWMEMQFLSAERRAQLAPLMKVWKEHRAILAKADVAPIGKKPTGRSFTGFYVSTDGKPEYLLLFREMNDKETGTFELPIESAQTEILCSNADVSVTVENGVARATFSKPHAYAFVKLK